jgi:hypothetical protein
VWIAPDNLLGVLRMEKALYPEGLYKAKVAAHYMDDSEAGNDVAMIQVLITGKVDDANPEKVNTIEHLRRTIRMSITTRSSEWIFKTLYFLGFDPREYKSGINAFDMREGSWSMVGNEVFCYCKHTTDRNGDDREEWGISRGVGAPEYNAEKDRSYSTQLLVNHLNAMDEKRGKAPKRMPAPAPEPDGDSKPDDAHPTGLPPADGLPDGDKLPF